MTWNCPQCGNSADSSTTICPFCSYTKFPSGIALVSEETGKEIQCRISTTFGAAALKQLGDSGLKYASVEQFRIEKKNDQGGWFVSGISYAKNSTFLNGAEIPIEGSLLKPEDKLSIKGKFLNLSVRVLY
jgi:hypothetical protein